MKLNKKTLQSYGLMKLSYLRDRYWTWQSSERTSLFRTKSPPSEWSPFVWPHGCEKSACLASACLVPGAPEADSEWWQQEALQHSDVFADPGQLPEVLLHCRWTSGRGRVELSGAQLCQVHFQHLSAATVGLQVASQTVTWGSKHMGNNNHWDYLRGGLVGRLVSLVSWRAGLKTNRF